MITKQVPQNHRGQMQSKGLEETYRSHPIEKQKLKKEKQKRKLLMSGVGTETEGSFGTGYGSIKWEYVKEE